MTRKHLDLAKNIGMYEYCNGNTSGAGVQTCFPLLQFWNGGPTCRVSFPDAPPTSTSFPTDSDVNWRGMKKTT
jgi:hypothetical protein